MDPEAEDRKPRGYIKKATQWGAYDVMTAFHWPGLSFGPGARLGQAGSTMIGLLGHEFFPEQDALEPLSGIGTKPGDRIDVEGSARPVSRIHFRGVSC